MSSAEEYRKYADECLGWAKAAKSDKEREAFLDMAKAWLAAIHHAAIHQIESKHVAERHDGGFPRDSAA
jgi:hypothetical protein